MDGYIITEMTGIRVLMEVVGEKHVANRENGLKLS